MASSRLSPAQEMGAGVLAGVADACACHPVDQIKTQFHVNNTQNGSMWHSLRQEVAKGGVTRLYRGLPAAALRPQALCMYTGNEWCKVCAMTSVGDRPARAQRSFSLLCAQRLVSSGTGQLTPATATLAGWLTGYVESVSVCPFELVKVRMQVKEHVGLYPNSLACARHIVAEEGVLALYRGLGATCARTCTFNGVYFGLIFVSQQHLAPRPSFAGDAAQNLLVGGAAGVASCVLKAPFDVVKSRIQAQLRRPDGTFLYRSTLQACAHVARTEGVLALWKGMAPMCTRMALGMSVSFAAFELALEALGAPRGSRERHASQLAEAMPHE